MKTLRIHYLQHVSFEGLGSIETWTQKNNATVSVTRLFQNDQLPQQDAFDWLIIMGGPMNIYQDHLFPWLAAERAFIKESINNSKVVLGICLGAQLIADALGEKVYSNAEKEIGWFPVSFMKDNLDDDLKEILPEELTVMHWHGDTFNLPKGASHLVQSKACKTQGFIYNNKVVALQFHLETTAESLKGLIENCGDEITDGEFIQSADSMVAGTNFSAINATMENLLNHLKHSF
nr:type 1 glutamine amidotransferase [Desulfobulbaceae bacterium]